MSVPVSNLCAFVDCGQWAVVAGVSPPIMYHYVPKYKDGLYTNSESKCCLYLGPEGSPWLFGGRPIPSKSSRGFSRKHCCIVKSYPLQPYRTTGSLIFTPRLFRNSPSLVINHQYTTCLGQGNLCPHRTDRSDRSSSPSAADTVRCAEYMLV